MHLCLHLLFLSDSCTKIQIGLKYTRQGTFFVINIAPKIEVCAAEHIALHPEGKCQESNFPAPRLPTSRKYLAAHLKFLLIFDLPAVSVITGSGKCRESPIPMTLAW